MILTILKCIVCVIVFHIMYSSYKLYDLYVGHELKIANSFKQKRKEENEKQDS